MNITIIVIILASIGFLLIGLGIVNSKYIKKNNSEDKAIINEIKAMKVSGYVNIFIGSIGLIVSIISLFKEELTKPLMIIFVFYILVLSLIQYILAKNIKR